MFVDNNIDVLICFIHDMVVINKIERLDNFMALIFLGCSFVPYCVMLHCIICNISEVSIVLMLD